MNKLFKLTKTSRIAFFVAMIASFIMAISAHAQETPEEMVKRNGISFPIAEFGNCDNYAACYTFCEDPVNFAVCKAYFKGKGLYKEEAYNDKVFNAAKQELGCSSAFDCESFCQKEENFDECNAFVDRHKENLNISGGYVQKEEKLVEKAKEILGCDSASSCKAFCSQEANQQKCDEFTSKAGIRGGIEKKGPGGCNSENTCKTFCSDPANFAECSKFGPPPGQDGQARSGFKGPGGCDSEDSCRSYCEKNPSDCKIITVGGPGAIDPIKAQEEYKKFCQANPGKCVTPDANPFSSSVGRTEFERFCEANPEKCNNDRQKEFEQARKAEYERICKETPARCQTGPGGYQIPKEIRSEGGFVDPGDYCRRYPERCAGGKGYNPETVCRQSPNCRWEGNSCRCGFYADGSPRPFPTGSTYPYPTNSAQPDYTPGPYSSSNPYPYYSEKPYPNYTSYPQATYEPYPRPYVTSAPYSTPTTYTDPAAACRNAGGFWTGSYCQMPAPAQTAAPQPAQTSAPAPQPEQQTQPQQQQPQQTTSTSESSGGSSGGGCPSGSYMKDGSCVQGVQGVSTARNWFGRLLDIFR